MSQEIKAPQPAQRNGGPAFPGQAFPCSGDTNDPGMSLRDYFAAKAMQALITALVSQRPEDWLESDQWAPRQAYEVADAMLQARKA